MHGSKVVILGCSVKLPAFILPVQGKLKIILSLRRILQFIDVALMSVLYSVPQSISKE